jgi:hypothetical protein
VGEREHITRCEHGISSQISGCGPLLFFQVKSLRLGDGRSSSRGGERRRGGRCDVMMGMPLRGSGSTGSDGRALN